MKNLLQGKPALSICTLILFVFFGVSALAQGDRRYIKFADGEHFYGLRIKHDETRTNYWVLAEGMDRRVIGLSQVDANNNVLVQKHIEQANIPINNGLQICYPKDFALIEGTQNIVVNSQKLSNNGANETMSLITFDNNANMVTGVSNDYRLTLGDIRPPYGKPIVYDRPNNRYVAAYNVVNINGIPGNLVDWGIAFLDANMNVTNDWQWSGADASQHEDVRDMCKSGTDFAFCGLRRDFANNRMGGLITKIDAAGNLAWQKQYVIPNYEVVFESVNPVLAPGGAELVVSGTMYPTNNPMITSKVIIAGIDATNGNVRWCYQIALAGTEVLNNIEGFRHTITDDMGIVVAGKITSRSTGVTSAMLLKMKNWSFNQTLDCENISGVQLFDWIRKYNTLDANNNVVNSSLRDVVQKLNYQDVNDVVAIGTAEVYHNNTLYNDVMFLEATVDNSYTPPRPAYSGDQSRCSTLVVEKVCTNIDPDEYNLSPLKSNKLTTTQTELVDTPWSIS
ncbi:MAG: hypothetical protein JNJ85_16760, partial [Candidatus Kapabacteria bacterium]|nr:hypothetical protein [Candidatus Kapabacteria bacterium]